MCSRRGREGERGREGRTEGGKRGGRDGEERGGEKEGGKNCTLTLLFWENSKMVSIVFCKVALPRLKSPVYTILPIKRQKIYILIFHVDMSLKLTQKNLNSTCLFSFLPR